MALLAAAVAVAIAAWYIGRASRRHIETSLRHTENRFALFTQRLPGLAWIKDSDGRYVYVNEAAEIAFGRPRLELYGKTDHELFPVETADRFRENDRTAMASGSGVFVEETLKHEDGTTHQSLVSKFPIPIGENGEVMVGGMAIDITERRRAEAELHAAEERLRLLVEGTREYSIFMVDPGGAIASWNAGAERIHGYRSDEILGQHVARFYSADEIENKRPAAILRIAARDSRADYEGWRVRKDGSMFWANIAVTALRHDDGRLRGFLEVTRDVTERRQAEQALRQADKRKDEFIATLSHELRNPLAPLSNGLQLLRLQGADSERVANIHAMMDRQIRQLARLIDDLLDVARITTGRIQLRTRITNVEEIVNEALEGARPHIDAMAQKLTVTLPDEPVLIDADPARVAQAILNLLNNASKFTDHGGEIWLSAARYGNKLSVRVRDNGIGIPKDKLSHIFEMFFQVDRTLERTHSGMGVGLSLVRAIVEMHGGAVECLSDGPGKGSEFVINLPLSQPAAVDGTAVPDSVPARAGPANLRLLVVDDNQDAAESFSLILQDMGNTVRTAYDGPTAIQEAIALRPHAVMLDIGLPGMSGYEVASKIREIPGLKDTVLIAVTGWGESEDRRRTRAVGFAHHVVKPVSRSTLIELIGSLDAPRV